MYRSFLQKSEAKDRTFHGTLENDNTPIMITISKDQASLNNIIASADPEVGEAFLKKLLAGYYSRISISLLSYRLIRDDAKLGSIVTLLHGLKPFRPPSLFEMTVVATI